MCPGQQTPLLGADKDAQGSIHRDSDHDQDSHGSHGPQMLDSMPGSAGAHVPLPSVVMAQDGVFAMPWVSVSAELAALEMIVSCLLMCGRPRLDEAPVQDVNQPESQTAHGVVKITGDTAEL